MADPASMFDKLAQNRQKAKATPPSEPAPDEPKRRQRKATGKRSDPNYIQVGAYIPKELNKEVKRSLVDYEGDFSDLIAELLEAWVKR
ncbi:hypothetical protein PN498_28330 [Oscillatoria sp. CS-180]|uniref:hypothetical protein n=1 Tax=Oscillatoria sp. CS-180 TaxID=3021720 RepID=UPI00232B9A9D|nr:hypothetical protein [Oscillatoria sp. CS-180]MDB9529927.1 hypothetical protein [Oscillatoria sp. CS-180]